MPGEAPFFTNGVAAASVISGSERIPADLLGSDSEFVTPLQIGEYIEQKVALPNCLYVADGSTVSFEPPASECAGARLTVLELNGALGGDATLTLPPGTNLATATPYAYIGETWVLRFVNTSSANHKWTIAASADGTTSIAGAVDIAQNTWREYQVVLGAGLTTAALQSIGGGTA